MAITPSAGYKVDPTNPNAVVKSAPTAMPGSVASINQTQPNISFGAVNTQPIPISTLTQNTPIPTTATPQPDTNNYQSILDGAKNQALELQKQAQALATQTQTQTADTSSAMPPWLQKAIDGLNGLVSFNGEQAYNDMSSQLGIDQKQQAVTQSQQELSLINADIQGIVDSAKAQQLKVEGQGRGQTIDFLQRQQSEIGKQAAIQALPLQALALAKSAVLTGNQNNLKLAQDKLDTVFKLKSEDADRQYKQKIDTFNILYQVASDQQKTALEEKKMRIEEERYNASEFNKANQSYVNAAFEAGDYATAAKMATATTYEELSKLASGIIQKAGSGDTQVVDAGGRKLLIDSKTGQTIRDLGASSSGSDGGLTANQINSTVNSIAGAFDNEPIVKEYNTIKRQLDTFNNLGSSATDDIQRVYTFAKVADPTSAVKEGEYNSIEKYSQALLQRAGLNVSRVFSPTGILTPEARNAMAKTLQSSLTASQTAYNNVSAEYQRQINDAYSGKPRQITNYNTPVTTPIPETNKVEDIYNSVVSPESSSWMKNLWDSLF